MKVLERRLRRRKTDRDESIQRRLAEARSELAVVHRYDYAVVNRNQERSFAELKAIVMAERCRVV